MTVSGQRDSTAGVIMDGDARYAETVPEGVARASAAPGPTAVVQLARLPSRPQWGPSWNCWLWAAIRGSAGTKAPAPRAMTAGSVAHGRGPWARAPLLRVSQPSSGQASGCSA